ncbi:MAG: nitroreductase family protein [Thermodesulfovibrionales bacterium]
MDLNEAISTRRSVRRFLEKDVSEESVQALIEAVRMSPSWANMQCWKFISVRDAGARQKLSELTYVESFFAPLGYKVNPAKKGIAEAPVVLVACADPRRSGVLWDQNYYMTDIGIASQTLMLVAHAAGLGTVFVGVFDEAGVKAVLGIPAEIRVVGLFPLGYPRDELKEGPPRKPLSEILSNERW